MSDTTILSPESNPRTLLRNSWPKLRLSAIFGILDDEEEKQENRMAQWNAAYQYLIRWFLDFQQMQSLRLKPFYAHPSRRLSDFDEFMDQLEANERLKAMSLLEMHKNAERTFAFQGAICAERTVGQIALLSHLFKAIFNLFTSRKTTLTSEQQATLWSGLSNTGSFHEFPLEEANVTYQAPTLPEDLLPEMHESALAYHRNVAGAVAAMLYEQRMRPHPDSHPILDEQAFFDETCELGLGLIYGLLQAEFIAQQKMAALRATALSASSDVSWLDRFDSTWDARPNLFNSPLIGVAPTAQHNFKAFSGPFPKNTARLQKEQWLVLTRTETRVFPIYQHEQANFAELLVEEEAPKLEPTKKNRLTPFVLKPKFGSQR